jgi:hypothetical protein
MVHSDLKTVPIGKPLPNYCCLILDEFSQPVHIQQDGELFVGGAGVFAGYLGREDLTAKSLIHIDGKLYYRTGDIVKVDDQGLIHYVGRKDFQVKLHGQRIELGEIERSLLDLPISACVVTKWGDHHLVAYVQGTDMSLESLRNHCVARLPSFMVPSMYVVLGEFPLNANGKLDRKRLPPPDFSKQPSSAYDFEDVYHEPNNELEKRVHSCWCELLHLDRISTETNLFSIGGHSLLIMQLYQHYSQTCQVDIKTLSITELFQYPTIKEHARIIDRCQQNSESHESAWFSLNVIEGRDCFNNCELEAKQVCICLLCRSRVFRSSSNFARRANPLRFQAAHDVQCPIDLSDGGRLRNYFYITTTTSTTFSSY